MESIRSIELFLLITSQRAKNPIDQGIIHSLTCYVQKSQRENKTYQFWFLQYFYFATINCSFNNFTIHDRFLRREREREKTNLIEPIDSIYSGSGNQAAGQQFPVRFLSFNFNLFCFLASRPPSQHAPVVLLNDICFIVVFIILQLANSCRSFFFYTRWFFLFNLFN